VRSEGNTAVVEAEGSDGHYSFEFAAPGDGQLQVGEYPGAERLPFQAKGSPGLTVSGNGRGCNTSYGRFQIKDVGFSPTGKIDRLWALYEQHCETEEAPVLFGEVRVGEPPDQEPEIVQPTAVEWPPTEAGAGTIAVPVTIGATEPGAHVTAVGIQGEDAEDFSITQDGCTGHSLTAQQRCRLEVEARPTAPGLRTARLVVTDVTGATTMVPLAVRAEPGTLRSVTMVSTPGDWVGGGSDHLFDGRESVSLTGTSSGIEVWAESGGDRFRFHLAAPLGEALAPGEYEATESEAAGKAGLLVAGDGRGCNRDYGRFVIKDIHFDGAGKVDRLWALYEQHCEQPGAPPLFGELRVEPATPGPESADPAAVEWPATAVGRQTLSAPVTIIGREPGAQIASVEVQGEDAADFEVTSDGCEDVALSVGARCSIGVDANPVASGRRTAQLVVTDLSGAVSSIPLSAVASG
jgi:hypothetical protein